MDRVMFRCPKCGASIAAPASLEGEASSCPKCGGDVDRWPAPVKKAVAPANPPPLPAQNWYYMQGQQRRGPVSRAQLRSLAESGIIRPSDLVWLEGTPEWVEAASIPGLFPPTAVAVITPPAVPVLLPRDEEDREERPRRRRRRRDEGFEPGAMVALVLGTLLIPLVGIIVGAIGIVSGGRKKQSQGAGLLCLGIVMCVIYYFSILEREFQERQRQEQRQQWRR